MSWWAFGHGKSVIRRLILNSRLSGLRRPTITFMTLSHPTAANRLPGITKLYLGLISTIKINKPWPRCLPACRISWSPRFQGLVEEQSHVEWRWVSLPSTAWAHGLLPCDRPGDHAPE